MDFSFQKCSILHEKDMCEVSAIASCMQTLLHITGDV